MKILVMPKVMGAELQSAKTGIYNIILRMCAVRVQCQCESRAGPAGVVVEQCPG